MIDIENTQKQEDVITPKLQLVAWEITRSCNLFCAHCRASAHKGSYEGELSTEECFRVIDEILEVGKPIIILTGGEPLLRPDALQLAKYAAGKGLRVVLGSNGTLISENMATRLKEIPVACVGISLDFPSAERQDKFRCLVGAFDTAMAGIKNARAAGLDVQINSTITKMNVNYLDELLSLALNVGAISFYPFLLVPTGRGKDLESMELSPQEYEQTLNWIYDKQVALQGKLMIRPICAPHFFRITRQRQKQSGVSAPPMPRPSGQAVHFITRGCLSGTGFCFISHRGKIQGCGYLDIEAGDLRKASFSQIWNNSSLFCDLRDLGKYKGKCGVCEYKRICGGCRARAYETTGGYLEAEPYCIYEPVRMRNNLSAVPDKGAVSQPQADDTDKRLLNLIQTSFPLTGEPYADLGQLLSIDGSEVIARLEKLKSMGLIRQISPVVDARSLGYQTTLVAMRVADDQLEKAEQVIGAHQGVSHGYERSHHFNVWFTLATPPDVDAETELAKITSGFQAEAAFALPALKLFKLDVYFNMTGDETVRKASSDGHLAQPVALSEAERLVVNEIQQALPFAASPFDRMAARVNMNISDFLDCCRSLLKKGVIRRYGASLNHRKAGFTANVMACWVAPPDVIDAAGQKLASLKEVSHCYERKTNPLWHYNLFAMIHGNSRDVCQRIVDEVSRETGLTNYVLLYSTKEFKKTRIKYLV